MKNKIMGILLSVVMTASSLSMTTVSAEDFVGETQILNMEEEESLETEEDMPDENLVEFGTSDDLEEGEISVTEEEEQQEEMPSVGDEISEFTDDAAGATEVTELELDKTVSFEMESGKFYTEKQFSFTPEESGFYSADCVGNLVGGVIKFKVGDDDKAAVFYSGTPYLIRHVTYSFSVSINESYGTSKGSITISQVGDSTDAYERYMAAGKSKAGNITWTLDYQGFLDVEGAGEVPSMGFSQLSDNIQQAKAGEGITKISMYAFSYLSNLTKITLPVSLEEIEGYAFSSLHNLTKVDLPENSKLKTVGKNAFWDTAFVASQTGDYIMLNNIVLNYIGNKQQSTIPESATLLSQYFVSRDNVLEEIDLSGNLKSATTLGVSGCTNLKKIKVGSNVTNIEYAAFVSNTALEAVELNEGVTEIGEEAFLDCPNLKKINIPKTVTTVGRHALGYSRYVTKDTYKEFKDYTSSKYAEEDLPVVSCWYGTAGYNYAVKENIPYEILDAKDLSNTTITKVAVDQTVSGSGTKVQLTVKFAEQLLKEGKDYTWSSSVSGDGKQLKISVKGCGEYFGTYETTVENKGYKPAPAETKPISLKKGATFKAGTSKYKVTGTNVVAYAGTTSKKATKITIGKTVTYKGVTYKIKSVAAKALKNNKKIKQVTIGANVTYIGASAFQGCKNLRKITVKTKVLKTVKSKAFKGIYSKAKIKVPSSKLKKYRKLMKKKGQGSRVKITK